MKDAQRPELPLCFEPVPAMDTERIHLRRLEESDVPEMFAMRSDPEVMRYLDKPCQTHPDEALETIRGLHHTALKGEGITWAICLKGEDKMIGYIGLFRVRRAHFRGELGYMLAPAHKGKGIVTEACRSVMEYGWKALNLHSMDAVVNAEHAASIQVLKKLGFNQEAHFHEDFYMNGEFQDTKVFGILNSEG